MKNFKKDLIITIAICLVILAVAIFLLNRCSVDYTNSNESLVFDLTEDKNIKKIDSSDNSFKLQEKINQKVEDGMINISMNINSNFDDSDSFGIVNIENSKINKYPQIVEIYLKDTNELIYKSGLIPVGNKLEKIKLDKKLEKGEYSCIAYFNAVNEKTGEFVGKAGAQININILE